MNRLKNRPRPRHSLIESLEVRTLLAAPIPVIDTPAVNATPFVAGQTIQFSGHANDADQGALPASAFHWEVVFHHDTHTHPYIGAIDGVTSGNFPTATTGEPAPNIWYRLHLTVTDSTGLTGETYVDVLPRTVNLTISSNLADAPLTLDYQPISNPTSIQGVSGFVRTLGAETNYFTNGQWYQFTGWSDGGAPQHDITTPLNDTTYTGNYVVDTAGPAIAARSFLYDTAPHMVSITFNERIAGGLQREDLIVRNETTGQTLSAADAEMFYDVTNRQANITFPNAPGGIVPQGRYTVTVLASGVTDPAGHHPAANQTFEFHFRRGDATGDGVVNFDDYVRIDQGFNQHRTGYTNGDFDYNGVINFDDYVIIDNAFRNPPAPVRGPSGFAPMGKISPTLPSLFGDGNDEGTGPVKSPRTR